jgi:hypothetical protein
MGLLCMLLAMGGMSQTPSVHFNYTYVAKAEEDHTFGPGTFDRYKILLDREILSVDRGLNLKKLELTFRRYDRAMGALIGTKEAEVPGDAPRFERMLHVNGHIYLLFTTREEKTHYKVYVLRYDEATGVLGQDRIFIGELNIANKMFDAPFNELETALRFEVSPDQHRVLMYNDELRTMDGEDRRVVSVWVFDDLLQPLWKSIEITPSKYKEEHFSDLAVTNEGDAYALNMTDLRKGETTESVTGSYTLYRWNNGQLNKARIELPEPLRPSVARMSCTGNGVLVTGFYADGSAPKERATTGAFRMDFGPDLAQRGAQHTYPLPAAYDHALTEAKHVARPDGGCYIIDLERKADGPNVNIDTGVLVFSINPSGEQEWFTKIPRAQRTQYQASRWAGGGQGYHTGLWNNDLLLLFYDTEANVDRYIDGQIPEMTDERIRTTMAAQLSVAGKVNYSRVTPKDDSGYAGLMEDHFGEKKFLFQVSKLNADGRSWDGGFGVILLEP